jgi:hypothetical protein
MASKLSITCTKHDSTQTDPTNLSVPYHSVTVPLEFYNAMTKVFYAKSDGRKLNLHGTGQHSVSCQTNFGKSGQPDSNKHNAEEIDVQVVTKYGWILSLWLQHFLYCDHNDKLEE